MKETYTRPWTPHELVGRTIESFDLDALATQLREEDAYRTHGRCGLTLARGEHLTMVLTVVKEGKSIEELKPPGPVTILLLEGEATLETHDGGRRVPLTPRTAVAFAPAVAHHVEAAADAVLLIVIGEKLRA